MKICANCQHLNVTDAEVCIKCGDDKFTQLLVSFYDDIEPYLKKENINEYPRVA